jgi:hypothetical protein
VAPTDPAAARAPSLWAAAARARDPLAEDPLLLGAGPGAGWLSRSSRGRLDIGFSSTSYSDGRGQHTLKHAGFAVLLDGPAGQTRLRRYRAGIHPAWVRWAAATCPQDTEPVFSRLVLHLLDALDYWEVDHAIPRALTALAGHPGRVGPFGAITAAAGLAAQDGSHRVLGVDAVAALAARGTLDPAALGTAMQTIARATRLARWAPSLHQVADAVGAGYVVDLLSGLVPHLPPAARGLVTVLDVLAEESTRAGRPVQDLVLREYLESFTGGSGSAAAARRTLAVPGPTT